MTRSRFIMCACFTMTACTGSGHAGLDDAGDADATMETDSAAPGDAGEDAEPGLLRVGSVVRIGDGTVVDPEVLSTEAMITFQDASRRLVVARLDPVDGTMFGEEILDTGLASARTTFNGPEFGLDRDGWSLYYSKEAAGDIQLWKADLGAAPIRLTDGGPHMTALASKDESAESVGVLHIDGHWRDGVIAWFSDDDPAGATTIVPVEDRHTTSPRWIDGTSLIVHRIVQGSERGQLALFDTTTGTSRTITDGEGDKMFPYGFIAPDYGGALVVLALVDDQSLVLYRDLGGPRWERVATAVAPEGAPEVFGSAEPFVAGGRSYASLTLRPGRDWAPGTDQEVWIMGLGPEDDDTLFRCDDGLAGRMRTDPETFIGTEQVFVYYNINGTDGVSAHRCATGIRTRGGM